MAPTDTVTGTVCSPAVTDAGTSTVGAAGDADQTPIAGSPMTTALSWVQRSTVLRSVFAA
ncbi:MAG: hypothetical protein R3D98_17365 [Candidatus Krumholzibacteriia bacterium]